MNARYRKEQKLQRWNESSINAPQEYERKLLDIKQNGESGINLANAIQEYLGAKSVYARIELLKIVIKALKTAQCQQEGEFFRSSLMVFGELLFVEHSRQMHKAILSSMKNFPGLNEFMVGLIRAAMIRREHNSREKGPPIVCLLACSAADGWMRTLASETCLYICERIHSIFETADILAGQLEEAQEGVSSIYTMVQRYREDMIEKDGELGGRAIFQIGATMMRLLQRDCLAREAMASAGVALFSAACLPEVKPDNLAYVLSEGLLFCEDSPLGGKVIPPTGYGDRCLGIVEQGFASEGTSLLKEIKNLSEFGRIGAIRALVSGVSFEILCHPLVLENSSTQSGCPLALSLRFLCEELSKPSDSHNRYHVLTAVVHCLQSFRTSLQKFGRSGHQPSETPEEESINAGSDMGDELLCISLGDDHDGENEKPEASINPPFISKSDCDLSIGVIWRHLEDPMPQTEQVVFEAFEILLDILTMQEALVENTEDMPRRDELMEVISRRLLEFSDSKKGKYTSLTALVRRVGGKSLLVYVPDLVDQVFRAFQESSVCRAASLFLKILLSDLLMESRSEKKHAKSGEALWRESWSGALLNGLMNKSEKVRINIATYVVPAILELDEMSLIFLVHQILDADKETAAGGDSLSSEQLGALLALLRVGRKLNLLPSLDAIVDNPGCILNVPFSALKRAIFHESEDLHVNALELACIHPKGTALPDVTDLKIVLHAVRVGGRSTPQNTRHKFVTLIGNFLKRMLVALNAKLVGKTQRIEYRNGGRSKDRSKATALVASAIMSSCRSEGDWIDPDDQEAETEAIRRSEAFMQEFTRICLLNLYPGAPFQRKVMAMELLSTVLSHWSKETWVEKPFGGMARHSNGITIKFQPFCPGFLGPGTIEILLGAAVDSWDQLRSGAVDCLMHFPAPFPGLDSAEKMKTLISWTCQLISSPRLRESDSGARLLILLYKKYACGLGWEIECHPAMTVASQTPNTNGGFNASLTFLESMCSWLERNVSKGKEDLLGQCEESLAHGVVLTLRYAIEVAKWTSLSEQQADLIGKFIDRLLAALQEGADLCLTVLSNQMMASMGAEDIDMQNEALEEEEEEEECGVLGPTARILSTGTWLTMKEISALLGTMARVIPMEGEGIDGDHVLLTASHLDVIGRHFMTALIRMKHNGAVDKTGVGFQELCKRLLQCGDQDKQRLPSKWMDALFSRILEKGQSRDDIVRRSGGLPFALDAIFTAEPHNIPKILLPRGLKRLLEISADCAEEPWTRTHALNSLRHVFNDKALATDAAAFFAEGVCVCVGGLSDVCWEVRNAAALCFTALTTRMVGYKNVAASGAARKSISAFEFFERYPSLHAFLRDNLQSATQQLLSTPTKVPPSLAPVLLLLARLLPSVRPHAINASTAIPSHLIPVVRRCTGTPHMAVRILAARSLVPLVSSDDLHGFVMSVMEQTPSQDGGAFPDSNLTHGNLLTLRTLLAFTDASPSVHKIQPNLLRALEERIWLLQKPNIACGIRLEYVRILMVVFSEGAQNLAEALKDFGSRVIAALDDVIENAESWNRVVDPMTALWLKECAKLRFGPVAYYGSSLWSDRHSLERALGSPVYEIQVAVLKSLSRNHVLLKGACPKETLFWMRDALVGLLQTVTNPKVLRRVLELLTCVLEKAPTNSSFQNPQSEWEITSRILTSKGGPINVRMSAVECAGQAGRCLLNIHLQEKNIRSVREIVGRFAEYLSWWSRPQCSIDLRLAVVGMLKSSEILKVPVDMGGDGLVRIWFSALDLLEDEEQSVRERCAGVVAKYLDFADETHGPRDGLHAEAVVREAVKTLVNKFGTNSELIKSMLDWVVDPSKNHEEEIRQPSPSGVSVPIPGIVRKMFDKELDNDHQEPLLRSQLAARNIPRFLTNPGNKIESLYQSWQKEVAAHLDRLVNEIEGLGNSAWVGGATNHPHFFVPMYRVLLGLWVAADVSELKDVVGKGLVRLVEKVVDGRVSVHPILGNLLACVLERYESGSGNAIVPVEVSKDSVKALLDDQFDPKFDPIFLGDL
ncbi:hypothetical protein BSKO_11251 [Bryopsis sp. KO-2023]|nr:hypothetical protein BSKO_11251 [Bryopsis sp. KO-2023]